MTMERIGDAERDQTTSALSEHYAAGRLTYEEFDQRVGMATHARTQMELDLLLHDLPSGVRREPRNGKKSRSEPTGYEAVVRKARNRWAGFVMALGLVAATIFWYAAALSTSALWWFASGAVILVLLVTGGVAWTRPESFVGTPRLKELPER